MTFEVKYDHLPLYDQMHFVTEAHPYCMGPGGKHLDNNFMIRLKSIKIWYSYHHIVAFSINDEKYVSTNVWSRTTGKHINAIEPDHAKRMPYDVFAQKFLDLIINGMN
ncbi:MAG: hypothetical protein WC437_04845 [Patescibacteria group bacterium]|jgi:hypothetical protein